MGRKRGYTTRKKKRQKERRHEANGYCDGMNGIHNPPENIAPRNLHAYNRGQNIAKKEGVFVWEH